MNPTTSITQTLRSIHGTNLLVLDRHVLPLINFLMPFLDLKLTGSFVDTAWLDLPPPIDTYDAVIAICYGNQTNLNLLHGLNAKRIHVIVPNLTKSFTYRTNKIFGGNSTFTDILENEAPKIGYRVRLYSWDIPYIKTEGAFVSGDLLQSYLTEPLSVANHVTDSLVRLFDENELKLKNVYSKGGLSAFVTKSLCESKLPEYMSKNKTALEIEFASLTAQSNTDLVVLERNLDWFSVAASQLTYGGLIHDLFGIQYEKGGVVKAESSTKNHENTGKPSTNESTNNSKHTSNQENTFSLTDDLFPILCNLNFSTVGQKLNKLARGVQQEYALNNPDASIDDIKRIVNSLGDLTSRQELIKKHTAISERIVESTGEQNAFLTFQHDLFELDYKTQVATILGFIDRHENETHVLAAICLTSIANDGFKPHDYEHVLDHVMGSYGLRSALKLEKLHEHKIVRIAEQLDFFGRVHGGDTDEDMGLLRPGNAYAATYALIDKFWNLHPELEQEVPNVDGTNLNAIYEQPSFALPLGMVPFLVRIVESLYVRDFLKYKPSNSTKRRPTWENLPLAQMIRGEQNDENVDDESDKHRVNDRLKNLVVAFIGGVTRAEIACLEHLGERIGRKVMVVLNEVVGQRDLIEGLTIG